MEADAILVQDEKKSYKNILIFKLCFYIPEKLPDIIISSLKLDMFFQSSQALTIRGTGLD